MKSSARLVPLLVLPLIATMASSSETTVGIRSGLVVSSTTPRPSGDLPREEEAPRAEALAESLAAGASSEVFIPIVLSSAGVPPSFFTSELTLANRGTLPARAELVYTAAFGGGSGSAVTTLAAGKQVTVADSIEYLRSLGLPIPDSGNRGGTLRVKFSGLSSPADGFASVRTTTPVSEGRAGLAYAGVDVRALPAVARAPDGSLGAGPWKATDYEPGDPFPAPAPPSPRASSLAAFNDTNPNGAWSLYIVDDRTGDDGELISGWCVNVRSTTGVQKQCSSQRNAIPGSGTGNSSGAPAAIYPSTLQISGLSGTVLNVSVELKDLNHEEPDDIDMLLVGPTGLGVVILSDAGGSGFYSFGVTIDEAKVALLLCGLKQNGQDRSNVAILNPGTEADGEIVVSVTVYSRGPGGLVSFPLPDETLAPGGFKQFNGILGTFGLSDGWVRVEKISGGGPLYAYAVINDQGTSDGSYIPPVPDRRYGGRELTVAAVVEAGAFATEVVLTNTTISTVDLTLTYFAEAIATSSHSAQVRITLEYGEQLVIPSFVQYLRNKGVQGVGPFGTGFAGPLFVSVPSSWGDAQGVVAAARTSSQGGAGRYGVFYTGVVPDSSATAAWLHGLQQNAENRTNVAFVNTGTGSTPDVFRIDVFDAETGQPAGILENVTVPSRSWLQIGTVLNQVSPGARNAYAKVTRTSGSGSFLSYAVVNDGAGPGERSGDGAFLPAERDCVYSLPASVTHGWSGGEASVSLSGSPCFWDAARNEPWIALRSAPDGSGVGTISYAVEPNPVAAGRNGSLAVAGKTVTINQLGNAAGPHDGNWQGVTASSRPISFRIDRNEVLTLGVSLNVTIGSCHAEGSFTADYATRPAVFNDGFATTLFVPGSGGGLSLELSSQFSSPTKATGTYRVAYILNGSSICFGFGGSTDFTVSRP